MNNIYLINILNVILIIYDLNVKNLNVIYL